MQHYKLNSTEPKTQLCQLKRSKNTVHTTQLLGDNSQQTNLKHYIQLENYTNISTYNSANSSNSDQQNSEKQQIQTATTQLKHNSKA